MFPCKHILGESEQTQMIDTVLAPRFWVKCLWTLVSLSQGWSVDVQETLQQPALQIYHPDRTLHSCDTYQSPNTLHCRPDTYWGRAHQSVGVYEHAGGALPSISQHTIDRRTSELYNIKHTQDTSRVQFWAAQLV